MSVLIGNEVIENSLEGYGARGTLASDPGASGTTLTLTTGHGARFPAVASGQKHRLQCEDELMICTAHTAASDTMTVTRAAEGTTGVAHAALTAVNAIVTADNVKRLRELSLPRKPYFISGAWYGPLGFYEASGGAVTNERLRGCYFPVTTDVTLDRIGISVNTAGAAGSVIRLGIYRDDGAIGPDALVLDAGTVDSTTTGRKEITISQALTPDNYWLMLAGQGTPASAPNVGRAQGYSVSYYPYYQGQNSNFTVATASWGRASIAGAFPSTLTPVSADYALGGDSVFIWVHVV